MTAVPRRSALALGLGLGAAVGLGLRPRPAQAAEVTVGDLVLTVPTSVVPAADDDLGRNWQWQGRTDDGQIRPRGVVLARADLHTDEPVEVLGLLLASTASGQLPAIRLTGRRHRTQPGGEEQTRIGLSYAVAEDRRYEGELAISPRTDAPSGLVIALTDGTLPTSFLVGVLDSIRWRT
jgi:hypothetical protein